MEPRYIKNRDFLTFYHWSQEVSSNKIYLDKIDINNLWFTNNYDQFYTSAKDVITQQTRKSFKIESGTSGTFRCLGTVAFADVEPPKDRYSTLQSYFLIEWPDRTISALRVDWDQEKYTRFDCKEKPYKGILTDEAFALTNRMNGFSLFGKRSSFLDR